MATRGFQLLVQHHATGVLTSTNFNLDAPDLEVFRLENQLLCDCLGAEFVRSVERPIFVLSL
jgi:hypothetical protein